MSARGGIRPLVAADLSLVLPLYTDPRTREFLGGPISVKEANERAARMLEEEETMVILAEDGETFAGIITLHRHHDGVSDELSYSLLPEYVGRGLATLAMRRMLTHIFAHRGISSVVCETQTANLRSIRLLERLGMRQRERIIRFGAEQVIYCLDKVGFE
jgi:ribosomal-protein-alanine N-acetyltransferase